MVRIDRSHAERKQKNLEISQIIDEIMTDYEELTFFRNEYAEPSNPDNWLYSDEDRDKMVFNGELKMEHYLMRQSTLLVMDPMYFDWAMDVAEKIEERLGLDVTLKEIYD